MKHKTQGKHLFADFWDCDPRYLNNKVKVVRLLKQAAKKAGATVIRTAGFKFEPQGLTAVVLLKESHISFHTYPEFKFVAIDIYTCGETTNPHKGYLFLKKKLKPKKARRMMIVRGQR